MHSGGNWHHHPLPKMWTGDAMAQALAPTARRVAARLPAARGVELQMASAV